MPLGDPDFGVGSENHISDPALGQIILYPAGIGETAGRLATVFVPGDAAVMAVREPVVFLCRPAGAGPDRDRSGSMHTGAGPLSRAIVERAGIAGWREPLGA